MRGGPGWSGDWRATTRRAGELRLKEETVDESVRIIAVEEHFVTPAIDAATRVERDIPAKMEPWLAAKTDALLELGDGRIAAMDAAGIDVQVIQHTEPGVQNLEPETAVRLAAESNDALAAACAAYPERLVGLAHLPTPDPDAAADELTRSVRELGLKGASISGSTHGRFMDDPFFDPILAALSALEVPLYLHPGASLPEVTAAYYSGFSTQIDYVLRRPAWGWHIEIGVQVLRMVLAGVFDRHPRLQLLIGHMGEAIPFMLDRWAGIMGEVGTPSLERPPKEYVLEHVHINTSGMLASGPLHCALDVMGPDRIMFGVDYPYSPNKPAVEAIAEIELDAAVRAKITHENAERFFKLQT
jgi:predicted TIM-barrel fold metal-dependent hydrolase